MKRIVLFFLLLQSLLYADTPGIYSTENGTVAFSSEAAQELINASSHNLRGLIDTGNRTFAFRIQIRSFVGFNNGLQREHFNENYLESDKYPEAVFKGKIIEQVDLTKDGKYTIRAKGILGIHGVDQERIIKCEVDVQKEMIHVESKFTVLLTDHDIKVPKVVHEKIASEIRVELHADFKKKIQ
jgi:hypothetical protein